MGKVSKLMEGPAGNCRAWRGHREVCQVEGQLVQRHKDGRSKLNESPGRSREVGKEEEGGRNGGRQRRGRGLEGWIKTKMEADTLMRRNLERERGGRKRGKRKR